MTTAYGNIPSVRPCGYFVPTWERDPGTKYPLFEYPSQGQIGFQDHESRKYCISSMLRGVIYFWHALCCDSFINENRFKNQTLLKLWRCNMKKLVTVLGVLLLVGVMAYPVFARGSGWGRGCSGWGSGGGQGNGSGDCRRDQGGSPALAPEQQKELNNLNQKFFNETSSLRNNIRNKQNEMSLLLNGENPDTAKLQTLQKELSTLKSQMADKRLAYRLETRKVAPQGAYGGGYGRGRGYGGNRGGSCWN